jgi:hypothetical protein
MIEVKLSAEGMKNYARSKVDNDFLFLVGKKEYWCSWIVAEFLSPKIAELHSGDPSITEYQVETNDNNAEFESFLSLGQGGILEINELNHDFFLALAAELSNKELYSRIGEHFDGDLSVGKALDRIRNPQFVQMPSDHLIDVLSSHFSEIDSADLDKIPFSTLTDILSQDSLRIVSEDALYDYISSRVPENPDYFALLRFVRFEYLSCVSISHFASFGRDNLRLVDESIWNQFCQRLVHGNPFPSRDTPNRIREINVPLIESDPVNGIIAHFAERDNREKWLRLGPCMKTSWTPQAWEQGLVSKADFFSDDRPNACITWDWTTTRIRPTHYTIATAGIRLPKSRVIETSMDGSNWTELDRQTDYESWKENGWVQSFPISNPVECRKIQLTQTGKNHDGSDEFLISNFDLFSAIIDRED